MFFLFFLLISLPLLLRSNAKLHGQQALKRAKLFFGNLEWVRVSHEKGEARTNLGFLLLFMWDVIEGWKQERRGRIKVVGDFVQSAKLFAISDVYVGDAPSLTSSDVLDFFDKNELLEIKGKTSLRFHWKRIETRLDEMNLQSILALDSDVELDLVIGRVPENGAEKYE